MIYICPKCKSSKLRHSLESYECMNCKSEYNIIAGIPDFRIFRDDIYSHSINEPEMVKNLLQNYVSKPFEQLLEICSGIKKYRDKNNYTAVNLIHKNTKNIISNLNKKSDLWYLSDRSGIKKK